MKDATPEPSGNMEAELTDLSVLRRRKQHLQELSEAYQAQLSGLSPESTNTDGSSAAPISDMRTAYQCFPAKLQHISRLEQLSAAASMRELDAKRAIALLCGKHMRYFVKATSIDLGRSTSTLGMVDIDLTQEGNARKVSRQQAQLALHPDGRFLLTNIGRRTVFVNGNQVLQHHNIHLEHLSMIDLAGIRLLFMVNHLAVHRLVARSQNLVL
ncbi:hypothetical protein ABBQ38_010254 [Trebouxia sp. C0009 RCD-2024]